MLINLQYDEDKPVCWAICIERRPGGRVPEAPGQEPDDNNKHHECMNAHQDWEERGIPLPDKYNPAVGLARGAALRQAVLAERAAKQAARERVAPPPREATP